MSELIRNGIPVMTFNQRSVSEILQMILVLGGIVGCSEKAERLVSNFRASLEATAREAEPLPYRPKVYFEEWMDQLISGIRWVEELIEITGGEPVFRQLREHALAKERIVDPADVVRANPDVIIASWCGKRVNAETIRQRPGWHQIEAVKHNRIYEIKSAYILQPGPAALTEGVAQLRHFINETAKAMRLGAHK